MVLNTATKLPVIKPNPFTPGEPPAVETEVSEPKRLFTITLCEAETARKLEYQMESCGNQSSSRFVDKLTGAVTGPYSEPLVSQHFVPGGSYTLCTHAI